MKHYALTFFFAFYVSFFMQAQCVGDTWDSAPEIIIGPDQYISEVNCNGNLFAVGTPTWAYTCQWLCQDENFTPICVTPDHDYFRLLTVTQDCQLCIIVDTIEPLGYIKVGNLGGSFYGGVQLIVYDTNANIIWATCPGWQEPSYDYQYIFADLGWVSAGQYIIRVDGQSNSCGCAQLTFKTITFLDLSIREIKLGVEKFNGVYDLIGRKIK